VLQPHLLASELFGHSKGAFTDAVKDRIGRFEYADGGTIFLDEIGDIANETQLQLLRVLQAGVFERLGESIPRKTNVRIIAATNRNIDKAISEGDFREDLFYRLNVIPIEIKPLRERLEDISPLVKYFVKKLSSLYNKDLTQVDDKILSILSKWNWSGNVRELENVIEYAVVRSKSSNIICACNLPPYIRKEIECPKDYPHNHKNSITATELIEMLDKYKWNKTKVADALGVNRSTLWRRMKSLGLT
jgi:transcriptional regulator with PAS, ATPase and Fis domain